MSKKIAIVGTGHIQDKALIAEMLAKQGHNDVVIVTPEEAKELANAPFNEVRKEEVYTITNHRQINHHYLFFCKGKHQYTEVDGEWVCQCGRNVND